MDVEFDEGDFIIFVQNLSCNAGNSKWTCWVLGLTNIWDICSETQIPLSLSKMVCCMAPDNKQECDDKNTEQVMFHGAFSHLGTVALPYTYPNNLRNVF